MRGADGFAFEPFRDGGARLLSVPSLDFVDLDFEPFPLNRKPNEFLGRWRLFVCPFRDLGPLCSETASWYSSDDSRVGFC